MTNKSRISRLNARSFQIATKKNVTVIGNQQMRKLDTTINKVLVILASLSDDESVTDIDERISL